MSIGGGGKRWWGHVGNGGGIGAGCCGGVDGIGGDTESLCGVDERREGKTALIGIASGAR